MIVIPSKNFRRSINSHNVELDVFCDWIEGSILFLDEKLSLSDVTDVLLEEEIYEEQSFAREMVMNGWTELEKRQRHIGDSCIFSIDTRWIKRKFEWQKSPAQAFCVLLSLATYYDWWISEFGSDYSEQGELFELLTKESLEAQFNNWIVYQTGWTRSNTSTLRQVVDEVRTRLCEEEGRFSLWDSSNAKESGLDLVWYRSFPDNRTGLPVFLVQCASGANWRSKLKTPDLDVWGDMIRFAAKPKRAFSVPFSFLDNQFLQSCVLNQGVLLDRCRLLSASQHNTHWMSQHLQERMVTWINHRINVLLTKSK